MFIMIRQDRSECMFAVLIKNHLNLILRHVRAPFLFLSLKSNWPRNLSAVSTTGLTKIKWDSSPV